MLDIKKWDAESISLSFFLFFSFRRLENTRDDGLGGLGKNDARRVAVVAKMSR